jgi:hypothetical protein
VPPRLHIGRTADDLQRRAASIHTTDPQTIGIRMRLDLQHASDNDTRQGRRSRLEALDLQALHGELMHERGGVTRRIGILTQPLFAELHDGPIS